MQQSLLVNHVEMSGIDEWHNKGYERISSKVFRIRKYGQVSVSECSFYGRFLEMSDNDIAN